MRRVGEHELVIVGGGLAGLMAAARAETLGVEPVLVDTGVPGTPGELGGFAPFSGAKFSLFPAGTGIAPLVGDDDELILRYSRICAELAGMGFPEFDVSESQITGQEVELSIGLAYRSYHSVLLTPPRINDLLAALSRRLAKTQVIRVTASRLTLDSGPPFKVHLHGGEVVSGHRLIMAAGRLGAGLLKAAGAPETRGKGIDVGVRLGFDSPAPLTHLRQFGPDAKFMSEGVRTFCLNSPGRIFHYPGPGFSLPGGIVAESDWLQSNVGVLCRLDDRQAVLQRVERLAPIGHAPPLSFRGSGPDLGWTEHARVLLGEHVVSRVDAFVRKLAGLGLVDLPPDYAVHYPLMDWHWPVFSLPGRLATGVPGVLAAGDASGHARGLMQAALMGSLAVEESLS